MCLGEKDLRAGSHRGTVEGTITPATHMSTDLFHGTDRTAPGAEAELAASFHELAGRWRAETGDDSSIMRIVMHPAYQRIIGMGPAVVPLILDDLSRTESHWFWALQSITGENPVPPGASGYVDRMTAAWLDWGRRNGILA